MTKSYIKKLYAVMMSVCIILLMLPGYVVATDIRSETYYAPVYPSPLSTYTYSIPAGFTLTGVSVSQPLRLVNVTIAINGTALGSAYTNSGWTTTYTPAYVGGYWICNSTGDVTITIDNESGTAGSQAVSYRLEPYLAQEETVIQARDAAQAAKTAANTAASSASTAATQASQANTNAAAAKTAANTAASNASTAATQASQANTNATTAANNSSYSGGSTAYWGYNAYIKANSASGDVNYIRNSILSTSGGIVQDASGTVLAEARASKNQAITANTMLSNNSYGLEALSNKINTVSTSVVDNSQDIKNSITSISSKIKPLIGRVYGEYGATCTTTSQFKVRVSANNATQFRVKPDTGNWSTWEDISNHAIANGINGNGPHIIEVEVRDSDGNVTSDTILIYKL